MDNATPSTKQFGSLDWLVGVGVALAALGLYISTLAPTVLEADAGEFQFVPWLPGIAHPTGYPLYILLGWLWTHLLPVGEVAWRMNLLSALFAAITVGLTYAVARRLLDTTWPGTPNPARMSAAALAAGIFTVTPTFWSQAIIAEVYALHALFVATILWLVLRHHAVMPQNRSSEHTPQVYFGTAPKISADDVSPAEPAYENHKRPPKTRSSKLLVFALGLGLTHHSTTILLLPAVLLFFWVRRKSSDWAAFEIGSTKSLATYALLFVTPLLLYLYLPLIASSTPYSTLILSDTRTLTLYDNSVPGFLRHVTGTVFAGGLQPTAVGVERLLLVWQLLRQQVSWTGIILAVVGLINLWQRRQVAFLLLTSIAFLSYVAFNLIYFIGDVFVLFIPAWLIVCLWIGIGSLGLAHLVASRFVRRNMGADEFVTFKGMREQLAQNMYRIVTTLLLLIFLVLPVGLLVTSTADINQKNNTAIRTRWQEILEEPLPESAILLSNDRNEIMPLWYFQYVERRRPDLLGLFPLIMPGPDYADVGHILDQALASGRPVYFIKSMDGLNLKANITPVGSLFRATAYDEPPLYANPVTLPEVIVPSSTSREHSAVAKGLSETINLLGYDLVPDVVSPGNEITLTLHWQTTQKLTIDYSSYVHIFSSDGQGVTQSDHQPGGVFYPSTYWQTGEILRDQHTLSIPIEAPAGVYRLRVGMYYQPEPGVIEGMGDGVEVGGLKVL
jgi:hypothetical protein